MSEFHHVPDVAGHLARARLAQAEAIVDAAAAACGALAALFTSIWAATNEAALAIRRAWLRVSA